MSSQAGGSGPGGGGPTAQSLMYRWDQIVSMFRDDLGLPHVTDDVQVVEDARDKKKGRWQREKRGTNPEKAQAAEATIDRTNWLRNNLDDAVEAVRNEFFVRADTTIEVHRSGDEARVTSGLRNALVTEAASSFSAQQSLAERWVDEFFSSRGLKIHGPLTRPQLVNNPRVEAGVESVRVSWELPQGSCDKVVVRRRDAADPVFRDLGSEITDEGLTPGQRYYYSIYSVVNGVESEQARTVDGVALGEVENLTIEAVERGGLRLRWDPPPGRPDIWILRSKGNPPARPPRDLDNPGDGVPSPVATISNSSSWVDSDVAEGNTYWYRVLACYESRWCSTGVVDSYKVARRPKPPRNARAQLEGEAVSINWDPPDETGAIEYLCIRNEGESPPQRPSDGTQIAVTDQTSLLDDNVKAGRIYRYAIFSRRGEHASRDGARTAPVATVPDVRDFRAEGGDECVTLTWKLPRTATATTKIDVSLYASRGRVEAIGDGREVDPAGPERAVDIEVENELTYHYLAVAEYELPNDTIATSSGVRASATPTPPAPPPEPPTGCTVEFDGNDIKCVADRPAHGRLVFLRCAREPQLRRGDRLSYTQIEDLGYVLENTSPDRTIDRGATPEEPFYAAFNVVADEAAFGCVHHRVVTPPVADVHARPTPDGVVLTWDWPRNCTACRVLRSQGGYATEPDRDDVMQFLVDRDAYNRGYQGTDSREAKAFLDDDAQPSPRPYYYVVQAKQTRADALPYSSGDTDAERCEITLRRFGHITLDYQKRRRFGVFGATMLTVCFEGRNLPADFGGIALVVSAESTPDDLSDGLAVTRWQPGPDERNQSYEKTVNLKHLPLPGLRDRLYCRCCLLRDDETVTLDPLNETFTIEL